MSDNEGATREDVLDTINGKKEKRHRPNFIWPSVKDEEGTKTAITGAVFAGGYYVIVTIATPFLQIFGIMEGFGDVPPTTSIAAAIPELGIAAVIAFVTFLLHRKSRIAAIAIAGWGVLDLVTWVLFIAPVTGAGFAVMRFLFALLAFHGVRGTFAWHRLKREGRIADKAKIEVFD